MIFRFSAPVPGFLQGTPQKNTSYDKINLEGGL